MKQEDAAKKPDPQGAFKDHEFWMRLAQKKMEVTGSVEAGLDFLRSGLSYNKSNAYLMYNFACANERLGNYEKAMRFFQYAQRAKPRWTDAVFGEALAHFKLKDFTSAEACVELALETYAEGSIESEDALKFFKAMCYKNLGQYEKASTSYTELK